jgi:hypothetical protein
MADDQKTGFAATLGGVAALIAAIAALIGAFHKSDPASNPSPQPAQIVQPQQPPAQPSPSPREQVQNATASQPAPAKVQVKAVANPRSTQDPSVEGYWSGIPDGIGMPLVLHLFEQGTQVTGTMMSPCQSPFAAPIDLATWDGHHLVLLISHLGAGVNPVTVDVALTKDQLSGSFTQSPYDGLNLTLHRGEDRCPQ